MAYYSRSRLERVSEALSDLRYAEMLDLCRQLSEMAVDRTEFEANLDMSAMADLMSDWAGHVEEMVAEKAAGTQ